MTGTAAKPVLVDLRGPLPVGTTVLEASAGTGKTYTIAGLVTRYVAEGRARIDELLAITFGRAATSELRTRVRERLVSTRDALSDLKNAGEPTDPVVAFLTGGRDAEVAQRFARLSTALASFDAATVSTTHQFCQQVLHGLGAVADLDPGTVLVENLDDLVSEVCDDLYLRFYTRPGAPQPAFSRADGLRLARAAVADGQAVLGPLGCPADSVPDLRVRFANGVREELERRKRSLRLLGFDDLLTRVRDALADPVTGEMACARLRERYQVVLVDEFQDTDPVQWEVLERAFHGHRTLVVIGDPKQAIYAFRGADVHAYLAARAAATTEATLGTNWRSDPLLLDGMGVLFRRAELGDPRIVVRPVEAGHRAPMLGPEPDEHPVRLRLLQRTGLPLVKTGEVQVDAARAAVARDLAASVVEVLRAGHTVTPRTGGEARQLSPGDIAVLVRTGAQAQLTREALLRVGVPSVLTSTSSVFGSPAAREWLVLLEALEQPHRTGRVRRFAVSTLGGLTAAQLDAGGDAATDALAMRLRAWGDALALHGVAALFAVLVEEQRLPGRLLSRPDGERLLSDLRHVAEALHTEALDAQLGLTGLLSWLRARVQASGGDLDQERSRRLDTDAAAVQVATTHMSKGLEFPVVLVPFGWDTAGGGSRERLPLTHDLQGRRVLHVGGEGSDGYTAACATEDIDEAGEELRLLYVAVTRAVSRLVLWWAPTKKTAAAPLHRLLFSDDPSTGMPLTVPVPTDEGADVQMRALASSGPACSVQTVPPTVPTAPQLLPAVRAVEGLRAAIFDRRIDLGWGRTSYTRLTHLAPETGAAVGSEPELSAKDDEIDEEAVAGAGAAPADEQLKEVPSPMAALPGGTAFGTLVHAVLEQADLNASDLRVELLDVAAAQLLRRGGFVGADELADALLPVVSTALGPLADHRRLRDFRRCERLAELEFELPLAGGDNPTRRRQLGSVADLMREHLGDDDPVAPYVAQLASPSLAGQPLRGYLTGSLDMVLRAGTPDAPRYVVVDHKTNRLADPSVPLTAWHYRRSALDAAMVHAHYPLQAMLYAVGLHRFLRWRQPDYLPERHLGGVLYLFLRGMCGAAVEPTDNGFAPGVWSWRPPPAMVVALSDVLAGGAP